MINVIFNKFDYEVSERKLEVWDRYNKVISWGRQHPLRFAERFLGIQFTDHQKYIFLSMWQAKFSTLVMSRNSGKALSLDTHIYTPSLSRKTLKDIKVGDKIYTASGELTEVIHLNPIIFEEVYEVEFDDGDIIKCNGEHLWEVYEGGLDLLILRDTDYIYRKFKKRNFKIRCTEPIIYPENCLENKKQHAPEIKFYSSVENRMELVRALAEEDEDGTRNFIIDDDHPQLTQDVCRLLSELGIKYTCTNDCVSFVMNKNNKKRIVDVRKTGRKEAMRCITVSDPTGLFLCGEKATVTHNSFLSAPYIMTRSILIPNHKSYIMSVTSRQAQETFKKMEDLALGNIASITGSTQVFLNEIIKNNARDTGFKHSDNSSHCELYNHSEIFTLTSVPENAVGMRSNLNLYDEAGKIPRNFFELTKPFTTQNSDFITGNVNVNCYPTQFPNQIILLSSAEDVFTELWDSYKLGAQEMMMGNPDYFVCDIGCDFSLHPYMNGEPYAPLLTKAVIDEAIAKNAFRANREYYNKFDVTGGQNCLVSKSKITNNSRGYFPVFKWEPGKKYVIVNDPSSKIDNSFILVAEIFKDENKGWCAKIVNGHNLIEKSDGGTKKLIQKPQQLEILKQYLVDYNGPANDYENLEQVIIDGGAGGGGFDMYQFILPGWRDRKGENHVGIIDLKDKYCQEVAQTFPEAKDILTLANFKGDKVAMYEAAFDALNQDLIIFPKDINGKGEMEFEDVDPDGRVTMRYERLGKTQLRALTEIELLKYELMAMEKTKNTSTNRVSYDLMPSKKSEGLHDDRADCIAMLSHYLMKKRSAEKIGSYTKSEGGSDFSVYFANKTRSDTGGRFARGKNPFRNTGDNPFI